MNIREVTVDKYKDVEQLKMLDITAPHSVEITIVGDKDKRIWVNIDGVCVLRCSKIKNKVVVNNAT